MAKRGGDTYFPVMKKMKFLKRILIWLLRFRKRRGYGVHSPFAFNLITGVFYEKTPYYDYDYLREVVSKTRKKSKAHWKRYLENYRIYELLFRLANYAEANTILEIGTSVGVSSIYLSCSRKNARFITLDEKSETNEMALSLFKNYSSKVDFRAGIASDMLPQAIDELETIDFLLLHPGNYTLDSIQLMVEMCLDKSNPQSVFVIQDIYSSHAIKNWWHELVSDQRMGITFDLYDMGIIFFDKKKIKQDYRVNF